MERKNICKFTDLSSTGNLLISRFVLETDSQIMSRTRLLSENRLMLAIEGEGNIVIDNESSNFSRGTLVFSFKGESLSIINTTNCKYMYIDFGGIRAEELFKRFNISSNNRCFPGFDGIIPLWEESLSRASDSTLDLATESMVIYTFSRLSDEVLLSDRILNKILQTTEEQFTNPELSISEIATELNYNSKYVSHLFKKKMGKNYSEYLRCLRVKYAVSLLNNGIDSIKNVALLSGFSDPLYFSTVFKNSLGLSPKEYIAKIKRNK